MKEINAKDSFLTLDRKIIECQDYETYDDCTTKNYMNKLRENCKCLPFQFSMTNEVVDCIIQNDSVNLYIQMPLCSPDQLECVKNILVDNSGCLKQCSGLLVTSYDQDRLLNLADYMSSKYSFRNMIQEYKGFCQDLFQYIVFLF